MRLREPLVINDRLVEHVRVDRLRDGSWRARAEYGKKRKVNGEWYAEPNYLSGPGVWSVGPDELPDVLLQYAAECRADAVRADERAAYEREQAEQIEAHVRALLEVSGG